MTENSIVDLNVEESGDNARDELLEVIADAMATLSDVSETPTSVKPASFSFSPNEVDVDSDAWMNQFTQIHDWLNIEQPAMDSREAYLKDLASALGLSPEEAVDGSAGPSRLTLPALEALRSRLEIATRLQAEFQEHLEQGDNRSAATAAWTRAWEDQAYDEDEQASSEPIEATADVWPIYQLVDSPLNLTPSYQRGDVWTTGDRSALIESILRGIPLPSIILLSLDDERRSKSDDEYDHEVVDGKQRLTAILRFVGNHPMAIRKVEEADAKYPNANLKELFKSDYPAFKKRWKSQLGETLNAKLEDEYYFPFKLRSGKQSGLTSKMLAPLRGKYYTQIKQEEIHVGGQRLKVFRLFEKPVDYKIPVIKYTKADPRQIHEVFKLYNKQGVHLNAEEIRNAIYHDVELTRAILFASGDADPRLLDTAAPALGKVPNLPQLSEDLSAYNFGTTRYRRTKVLGWLISTLVHDTGKPFASTASHTNSLLEALQADKQHKLNSPAVLIGLFEWLTRSIHVHAAHHELWSDLFKNGETSSRWMELQLVGSLIGIAMATIAHPNDIDALLDEHVEEIFSASQSQEWRRPEKTQTKQQWDYIARVAQAILDILEIDAQQASQKVRDRFGSSGYECLQKMRKDLGA